MRGFYYDCSQSLSTGVTLPRETWSHVTIQLDSGSQTVVVYVNGTQVYSSSVSGSVPLASSLATPSSRMSIMLNEESISGNIIKYVPFSMSSYIKYTASVSFADHLKVTYRLLTGYIISGYLVEFTTLSDAEVATLSSACHIYRQTAFFSMDTIANLSQVQPTTTFLSPSVCDSKYYNGYSLYLY